jgi:hypothetical protein
MAGRDLSRTSTKRASSGWTPEPLVPWKSDSAMPRPLLVGSHANRTDHGTAAPDEGLFTRHRLTEVGDDVLGE